MQEAILATLAYLRYFSVTLWVALPPEEERSLYIESLIYAPARKMQAGTAISGASVRCKT